MMTEEETKETEKPEPKTKEEKKARMIEDAEKAAERLEKANQELKALLERQEENRAKEILSGRSNAGQPEPEKPRELSEVEYLKAWREGKINLKLPGT